MIGFRITPGQGFGTVEFRSFANSLMTMTLLVFDATSAWTRLVTGIRSGIGETVGFRNWKLPIPCVEASNVRQQLEAGL